MLDYQSMCLMEAHTYFMTHWHRHTHCTGSSGDLVDGGTHTSVLVDACLVTMASGAIQRKGSSFWCRVQTVPIWARPKSVIFAVFSLPRRTFRAARSQWMIPQPETYSCAEMVYIITTRRWLHNAIDAHSHGHVANNCPILTNQAIEQLDCRMFLIQGSLSIATSHSGRNILQSNCSFAWLLQNWTIVV